MKNRNHIFRVVLTTAIGLLIIYKTHQFKYTDFLFDVIIYQVIGIVGLVIWGRVLWQDSTEFKKEGHRKYWINGIIGGISLISMLIINWNIQTNFNKPSLVKIYCDGDINGVGIDFKKDGTYIFDSFSMGSDYEYGTYQIKGDKIELDKKEIDNVIKSNRLKILAKEISYSDITKEENYVAQIDENGNKLENTTEFKVIIDNRKK